MIYKTLAGREISRRTATDLFNLCRISLGEHVAGRLWDEVFTEKERTILGGDFRAAYCATKFGGVGMYQAVHPGWTPERALLDSMRSIGRLEQSQYERILRDIGESDQLPASSIARPRWLMTQGELSWQGRVVRRIRQPKRAGNMVAVLDAFERHGWPAHLPLAAIKNIDHLQIRQTIYDLNGPLKAIRFRMDGSGTGVIWEMLPAARGKRAADGQATNTVAKPSGLRRTKRGRR